MDPVDEPMDTNISPVHTIPVVGEELQQAEISLRRARNLRSPINALSPEIISHIFWMLRCPSDSRGPDLDLPHLQPDVLLHVCHHWREIAYASSILWSDIDLDLHACASRSNRRLERAIAFATHSREIPLELLMMPKFPGTVNGLADFCGFVAPRLQSLELETEGHAALFVPYEQSWLIAPISEAMVITPGIILLKEEYST